MHHGTLRKPISGLCRGRKLSWEHGMHDAKRFNESQLYECMNTYEDKIFDAMMKCLVDDYHCMDLTPPDPSFRCSPPKQLVKNFTMSTLQGSWWIVRGLNRDYDSFERWRRLRTTHSRRSTTWWCWMVLSDTDWRSNRWNSKTRTMTDSWTIQIPSWDGRCTRCTINGRLWVRCLLSPAKGEWAIGLVSYVLDYVLPSVRLEPYFRLLIDLIKIIWDY